MSVSVPPVAAVPPDSSPPDNIKDPPVPVAAVFVNGCMVNEFPSFNVVMSGLLLPASFITPFSSNARLVVPPVCKAIRVFVTPFVSFITNALAVPWFVIKNCESVVVSARVNEISLLSLVVIVLPKS